MGFRIPPWGTIEKRSGEVWQFAQRFKGVQVNYFHLLPVNQFSHNGPVPIWIEI